MRQSIVGDLVARSFDLYRRHFGLVLSLTLPVVVVVFVLTALGLGELNASYRTALPLRDFWIEEAASQIVTTPLITAMLARFVLLEQRGERISATDLLAGALEAFPAVLLVVLVWLTVSVALFAILILPGVYFAVSWFFVVQAVVIDGDRGLAPLTRSASLVRLRWWRSAGVGLAFQVLVTLASAVIGAVFAPIASAANSDAVFVAGGIVAEALTLPFLAIGATLYYLQLRESPPAAPPRR